MQHTLEPNWDAQPTPFRHTWRTLSNIDQFRWLSRADTLRHLAMARDEIGVRHVRAAAMYSPEMRVWAHDLPDWRKPPEEKERKANWQLIDITIEQLLEIGIKPIYTTCFTPRGFTDCEKTCWPDRNPVGMPRDLDQWATFVADGIRHHQQRFGREELRSWYFECWNEPNLPTFFAGSMEDFFRLWSATWKAVKSVDSELRFGGPSTARGEWMAEFLDWTAKDGTPPDYLVTHVYNNDSESEPLSPFDGPAAHRVKDSPHFATGVIRGLRQELDRRGWRGEVHWNEWGRSWFPHDPMKETALEPAFIAKTMIEASHAGDEFAFWCLSDIYDQTGFQSSEFQANYGLLSLHGLRKCGWFAHMLLNRLGREAVPVEGTQPLLAARATRENGKACVLISAYPEKHDAAPEPVTVRVRLPAGAKGISLTRLGATENNIVATWRDMGAPPYPDRAQIAKLRATNTLQAAEVPESAGDGFVSFPMESPGVACLQADFSV